METQEQTLEKVKANNLSTTVSTFPVESCLFLVGSSLNWLSSGLREPICGTPMGIVTSTITLPLLQPSWGTMIGR